MKRAFFFTSIWLMIAIAQVAALELEPKGKSRNSSDARIENITPYVPDEILVRYRSLANTAMENDLQSLHNLTAKKNCRPSIQRFLNFPGAWTSKPLWRC